MGALFTKAKAAYASPYAAASLIDMGSLVGKNFVNNFFQKSVNFI
jgi:hypothetical protein